MKMVEPMNAGASSNTQTSKEHAIPGKHNEDQNGFIYKESRTKANKKKRKKNKMQVQLSRTKEDIIEIILLKRHELELTPYIEEIFQQLDVYKGIQAVVSYGLGQVETSRITQYQLALLIELQNHLGISNSESYEPVFSNTDIEVLTAFQINGSAETDDARRRLDRKTIVYMPHCGRGLYENIISSNWSKDNLSRLVLIGNRLDMYSDRIPWQRFERLSPMLSRAVKVMNVVSFPEFSSHNDIFNDFAWHTFDADKVDDWIIQEPLEDDGISE